MNKMWLKNIRFRLHGSLWGGKLIFDKKYRETVWRTRAILRPFYRFHSESLEELLRVKNELIAEVRKKYDKDFNEAALLLLSRSIQNTETVFLLTERGLYGSAFGPLRNVLSDMNMFFYLHYNSTLIPIFINESKTSYQVDDNFKSRFNEGAIDKDLKKRGIKSIKEGLQVFSKTMHASVWGAQLYGTEGKKLDVDCVQFHAKYGPGFETKKALGLLTTIFTVHWDYLCMILYHRKENKLDLKSEFWKKTIKHVNELEPKIQSLSDLGEKMVIKLNSKREGMDETEMGRQNLKTDTK